jgi:hypothetical protein
MAPKSQDAKIGETDDTKTSHGYFLRSNRNKDSATTVSATPTATRSALVDLPSEILHLVVDHLWKKGDPENWSDRHTIHGRSWMNEDERLRRRRDVLALSSCSKGLRQIIFRNAILTQVTVKLEETEFAQLASLSEDFRSCIR